MGKRDCMPANPWPALLTWQRTASKDPQKSWDFPRIKTFRRDQPFGWPRSGSSGKPLVAGFIRIGRWKESAFEVPVQGTLDD
jgi:hypothetical protein